MSTRYMMDTNTVSYIVKGKSRAARKVLSLLGEDEIGCISVITEAEIRFGLAKKPAAHALIAAIDAFLLKVEILPWGREEAAAYGKLRAKQEASGKSLGNLDMLIAAHAISVGAILITNDRAFSHVDDLRAVENWAIDVQPIGPKLL